MVNLVPLGWEQRAAPHFLSDQKIMHPVQGTYTTQMRNALDRLLGNFTKNTYVGAVKRVDLRSIVERRREFNEVGRNPSRLRFCEERTDSRHCFRLSINQKRDDPPHACLVVAQHQMTYQRKSQALQFIEF